MFCCQWFWVMFNFWGVLVPQLQQNEPKTESILLIKQFCKHCELLANHDGDHRDRKLPESKGWCDRFYLIKLRKNMMMTNKFGLLWWYNVKLMFWRPKDRTTSVKGCLAGISFENHLTTIWEGQLKSKYSVSDTPYQNCRISSLTSITFPLYIRGRLLFVKI